MAESQVIKSQVIKSISRQVLKSQDLATSDLTTCDLMTEGKSHPRFLPGSLFLPVLQEPAVADLLEVERPVLHVRVVRVERRVRRRRRCRRGAICRRSRTDCGSSSSFSSMSLDELLGTPARGASTTSACELARVEREAILGATLVRVGTLEVAQPREFDLHRRLELLGPVGHGVVRRTSGRAGARRGKR